MEVETVTRSEAFKRQKYAVSNKYIQFVQCRYIYPLNMVQFRSYQMCMKRGETGVLRARDIVLPVKANLYYLIHINITYFKIQSAG